MTRAIRLVLAPPVAEIVLDKPEKRNALSIDMWAAIPAFVAAANADPAVKVLLLHGGDTGVFAAGADISEFGTIYATEAAARASGDTIAAALGAIEASGKPVIAAIEGACVGGGVSLAMAADLRVAGEGARFGVTPGKLGLVYPPGDTARLVRAIGTSAAKDLLFTGRLIEVPEAVALRLVDRRVPAGGARAAARQWAEEIAAVSQWSVRAAKRMIAGLEAGWTEDTPAARALFLEGFANADFNEGYRAFLQKRPPGWKIP